MNLYPPAEIQNRRLREVLLDRDSFDTLGDIILKGWREEYAQSSFRVNNRTEKELSQTFIKIKNSVDQLLDSYDVDLPPCSYGPSKTDKLISKIELTRTGLIATVGGIAGISLIDNEPLYVAATLGITGLLTYLSHITKSERNPDIQAVYSKLFGDIIVNKELDYAEIPFTLAHEYTHHVQNKRIKSSIYPAGIFEEGHAIGMERQIAKTFQEGTEEFAYGQILPDNFLSLIIAYKWISQQMGFPQKKVIRNISNFDTATKISDHDLGDALFSIFEERNGPKIYREVLEGKFPWVKK